MAFSFLFFWLRELAGGLVCGELLQSLSQQCGTENLMAHG